MLDPEEVAQQYRCPDNLQARIALHRRYSRNPYPWFHWLFDNLLEHLPDSAPLDILELGCGSGQLWQDNLPKLPAHWRVTLSDTSAAMLATAQQALPARRFRFATINAEQLSLAPASVDVIIANHMLYHLSDVPAALEAIARSLRPQGCLFAATNGEDNMLELAQALDQAFAPCPAAQRPHDPRQATARFTLENGLPLLEPHFEQLQRYDYPDALEVDDVAVLMAYVRSLQTKTLEESSCFDAAMARLEAIFQAERQAAGQVHIRKYSGLLQACHPR